MNVRKAFKHAGLLLASVGILGLTACEDKPTETPFPAMSPAVTITGIQITGGVTRVFASASDEDGQVESFIFAVDGGTPDTLDAPVYSATVIYGSMDEEHTVTVTAVDNEGLDSDEASLTYTPNTVGAANKTPETEILAPDAGATTSAAVVVEWASRDPDGSVTGYQVSFDGGDWVDVSVDERSYTKTGLSVGSHYVQVRAKDNFNVWDPTPATVPFAVVTGLEPELSMSGLSDGDAFFAAAGQTVSLPLSWSADAGYYNGEVDHYEYDVDSTGVMQTTDESVSVSGLAVGSHTFDLKVVDKAGGETSIHVNFDIAEPTLTEEVLVVNGVDWGTYGPDDTGLGQLHDTYPIYFSTDNADTWDYWDIMPGAPDYAGYDMEVNVIGTGTPDAATLGQYKVVLWMGQNYNGDLDSWNAALMAGYVNAGGKLYYYGRWGGAFFDATLMDMAGITGFAANTSAVTGYTPTSAGSALNLQSASVLTTSYGQGITGVESSDNVEVLFTDPSNPSLITGIRAKASGSSDWNIVFVAGRNYRASPPANMAQNIRIILKDVLGVDPPGSY